MSEVNATKQNMTPTNSGTSLSTLADEDDDIPHIPRSHTTDATLHVCKRPCTPILRSKSEGCLPFFMYVDKEEE